MTYVPEEDNYENVSIADSEEADQCIVSYVLEEDPIVNSNLAELYATILESEKDESIKEESQQNIHEDLDESIVESEPSLKEDSNHNIGDLFDSLIESDHKDQIC